MRKQITVTVSDHSAAAYVSRAAERRANDAAFRATLDSNSDTLGNVARGVAAFFRAYAVELAVGSFAGLALFAYFS